MQYYKQDDFDAFVCSAGACPESCCKSWQICIDHESLKKYAKLEGPFGNRVKNSIDFQNGAFLQYTKRIWDEKKKRYVNDERCALLNDDGYCDLQLTLGEGALCDTCNRYPRHEEEYEGVRELSLSLSCPEAARMLVMRTTPFSFIASEDDEEELFEDFDYLLYTKLSDMRELLLKIISDRSICFFDRLRIVFQIAMELQQYVEDGRVSEMDIVLNKYSAKADEIITNKLSDTSSVLSDFADASWELLYELEVLRDDWREYTDRARDMYLAITKGCGKSIDVLKELSANEEIAAELIFASLIFTYVTTAVYDDLVFSKVALCTFIVFVIFSVYKSSDDSDEKREELERSIYKCCREIEHSDNNLVAIDDYFETWFMKRIFKS